MTALQALRAAASHESLALVIDDHVAKKVAVAWKNYSSPFTDFEVAPCTLENLVNLAWRNVQLDGASLAFLAGEDADETERAFNLLRRLALIYPDGTVYEPLLAIIRNELAQKIREIAQ